MAAVEIAPSSPGSSDILLTLSDVEKHLVKHGTWIPKGKNNVTVTHYEDNIYERIGRMVFVSCGMRCKSNGLESTTANPNQGRSLFTGLPYTAYGDWILPVGYTSWEMRQRDYNYYGFTARFGTKDFDVDYWAIGRSWLSDRGMSTTEGYVRFSGVYITHDPF